MNNPSQQPVNEESIIAAPQSTAAVHSLWAVPLGLIFLLCALGLGGQGVIDALAYSREGIAHGEWWRLVGGSLVHAPANAVPWGKIAIRLPWHLFLNVMAIVVLVLLCQDRLSPWEWLRRVLCLALGMSAGLWWFAPEYAWYVGFSGVLHGLFLLGLVPHLWRGDWVAAGCLVYLFGKLGYELIAGAPVSDEAAIGMPVALPSHLWGSVAGLIYGVVFGTFRRPSLDTPSPL